MLFTAAPHDRITGWLTSTGFAAAAAGTIMIIALHLQRGYGGVDPIRGMLSDYALQPWGWVFKLGLIVTSAGSFVLWLALARHRVLHGRMASMAMAAWCVGLVCIAAFAKDRVPANYTIHGGVHLWVTALACGAMPVTCLVVGWRHRKHTTWHRHARLTFALALCNLPCVLPFVIAFTLNTLTGTEHFSGPATGLIERGMGLLDVGTLVVFGLWARHAARTVSEPAPTASEPARV